MWKKIWKFIKNHKLEISIILNIFMIISSLFGRRNYRNESSKFSKEEKERIYRNGYRDGRKDGEKFQKNNLNIITIPKDSLDKIIDNADSKGFERGFNAPGSSNIRGNMTAKLNGIRLGHHYGRTSVLLGMDKPDMNNPDQRFMAESYNTKVVKMSQDESERLLKENKFDKEEYMKSSERIAESIYKDFN